MPKLNNNRKFPHQPGPRPDLAKIKRQEAVERQEAYDKLSVQEKIDLLDRRLGKGVGATKQRLKLSMPSEKDVLVENTEAETVAVEEVAKPRMKAKDRRSKEQKNNG